MPLDNPPGQPLRPSGMADPVYRKKRRATRKPFNFELDPLRRTQLAQVALARGISQAATLRQLISSAFQMAVDLRPTCVSGTPCFMPQVHPQPPPNTPTKDPNP